MSAPNFEKEPGPQGEVTEEKKKREYKDFGHDEEKPTRMFLISRNVFWFTKVRAT